MREGSFERLSGFSVVKTEKKKRLQSINILYWQHSG
jgi:hypothetical protein